MAVIFTRAHVPAGLENAWLQHLRDFDTAHPGCVFQVMVDPAPERSMTEIVEMLTVTPGLTFQQFFERAEPGQRMRWIENVVMLGGRRTIVCDYCTARLRQRGVSI